VKDNMEVFDFEQFKVENAMNQTMEMSMPSPNISYGKG
jgi:hypothetical protein